MYGTFVASCPSAVTTLEYCARRLSMGRFTAFGRSMTVPCGPPESSVFQNSGSVRLAAWRDGLAETPKACRPDWSFRRLSN
jgi:hypothetical protein